MNNPAFQDLQATQYEDLYHVDDAPVADLRVKALSRMGWWVVIFALTGVLAGALIILPDTIQTPFVLKSEVTEDIYRFPSAVYVERIHVRSGQKVKAGDVILEISAPDIAALTAELTSAQANLKSFEQFKSVATQNERQIIEVNIQRIREEIALKKSQLAIAEQKWASDFQKLVHEAQEMKRLFVVNQELYKNGDVSKNELNQHETNALRAKNAQEIAYQSYLENRNLLQRDIASKELEISGLEKQISKNNNDHLLEGDRLKGSFSTAQQRLKGTYGTFEMTSDNHLLLKAKHNGTVSFVFEGDKEVAPSTILLKMIYEEAPLYAYAQVNSSQIGKVKVGQEVVMKLDAYPVYEWGGATGSVSEVSLTPDEKGMFNVRVQVEDLQKLRGRLNIGMLGKANIVTDERTIFGYLFRKFQKTTSELVE
ncbi:HlyD family secretion protein [Runella limosa]|uniref:HlyD family secretion protein n=1 Tax=Runella limosa TaxID=370978 RepID=UPI0003FDF9AF|nr:HlyD family efflux transporter periplasmic adaptor subunit [Runella limosa]